jgi:deoxyadenosine/deoxycytidine kinase
MNKIIISVEGNIGVGKSTFTQIIQKFFKNSCVVTEPVDVWKSMVDMDGDNILNKFYKDTDRWAYSFQNLACITRMIKMEESIKDSKSQYIFLDRSIGTDKNVFEKMLYDNKKISEIEHNMYNLWCDFYHKYVRSETFNIIIYLRCNPNTAYERIMKRNRDEEKNISLEYLSDVHKYHEQWLITDDDNMKVIIIDCDKDFENDISYQEYIIAQVKSELSIFFLKQFSNVDNFSGMFTNSYC